MLKEIHFENWKSFKQATLYIDQLTVLIGTNASGKSNAVEGLEFLRRIISGKEIKSALAGDSSLPSLRGGLEWIALKPENQFTLSVLVEGDENTDYFYSITVELAPNKAEMIAEKLTRIKYHPKSNQYEKTHFIRIKKTDVDSETQFAFETDSSNQDKIYNPKELLALSNPSFSILGIFYQFKNLPHILIYGEMIRGINKVASTLQNIFLLNPIPANMRTYTPLSNSLNHDANNIAGVLANLPDEKKIESILSSYIRQLPERDIRRIYAEPVGKIGHDAMLYCEEEWVNGEITLIDAHTISDGTLYFLAILVALLTRPEGSQLIIEEVDNGLHPSRVGILIKILKELGEQRKIDILVTTHNPALLDNLGPEMVPYVEVAHRDIETGTSQLTLLEDINNLPKLFASGTLGKITMQGKLEKSLTHSEPKNA
jgi:predicted ATPase